MEKGNKMKILYEIVEGRGCIYSVLTSRGGSDIHREMRLSYSTWKNTKGTTAMCLIYRAPTSDRQYRSLNRFLNKIEKEVSSFKTVKILNEDVDMPDKEFNLKPELQEYI